MNSIKPCIWIDKPADAAASYYRSIFSDSSTVYANGFSAEVVLQSQLLMILNGGDQYKLNEAISFVVPCANQQEIDYYWDRLTAGQGREGMCGWCKDEFGLSWQVIPVNLSQFIGNPDRAKAERAMQAMRAMKKLDIAALESSMNS